jgi:hypothetical protein
LIIPDFIRLRDNRLLAHTAAKIGVNQSCGHLCFSSTLCGIRHRRLTTPSSECSRLEDPVHTLTIALGAIYDCAEIPPGGLLGYLAECRSGSRMQLTI